MFKKLLHLLQKDVLLMRRSKVWTGFEVAIPLILIAFPAAVMIYAKSQAPEDAKSSGPSIDMMLSTESFHPTVSSTCQDPSYGVQTVNNVENYWNYSPMRWDNTTNSLDLAKNPARKLFIKDVRACKKIVYIVEDKYKTTMVLPAIGRRSYNFRSYNYYMNKIMFGLSQRANNTSSIIENFDIKLYSITNFEESGFGQNFGLLFAVCMLMPVISVARALVVEKSSVKPYLTTIGLPLWMFYLEHFLFGVIKNTFLITLLSTLYIFSMDNCPTYVLAGIFMYTCHCVSFSILCTSILPFGKRIVEGMVIIWITLIIAMHLSLEFEFDWLFWVPLLNPNYSLKLFVDATFLASGPNGTPTSALFSSKKKTLQSAAVYFGIMISCTVVMLVAAIFMEKLYTFVGHAIFKRFWRILGFSKGKRSKIEERGDGVEDRSTILQCKETVEGRGSAIADIELSGLVKVYQNGEKAVNGLSLRAIRGQVSILLGHNGCGKSTTFGMITGMHQATEGKVMIGGIDANANRAEARELIGYCPQYNPIYDELTVWEHLRLVNALKGRSGGSDFKMDAESLLKQIELTDKRNTLAKNLSGGMKRKLCVCMAMIGGSRVILLDEPTAGMDPSARIDVQNMLALVKADRTILLTTHYMDEAEKLGDWIFVMSHGKMAASGSKHYLKQKYGGGMLLTLVFKSVHDPMRPRKSYETAYDVCKTVCSTALVKDERGQMIEISILETEKSRLPTLLKILESVMEEDYNNPEFQALEPDIQEKCRTLELATIGVSMSSLEQVFIKIGDECDDIMNGTGVDKKTERQEKFSTLVQYKIQQPKQGFSKLMMVVWALLQKRAYYLYRNPVQITLQIILPLLTLWLFAVPFLRLEPKPPKLSDIESFDPSQYPHSTVLLQLENENDDRLANYLNSFSNFEVVFKTLGFIVKVNKKGDSKFYKISQGDKNAAILMNIIASAMYLRDPSVTKLPHVTSRVIWMNDPKIKYEGLASFFLFENIFFLLVLAGIFIQSTVYLIEEKICKFAHQQYLTGLSTIAYWGVVFLWDFLLFTFFLLYTIGFLISFGVLQGHIHEIVVIFYGLLFYFAPLVYLTSALINTPTRGNFLLYMFCCIPWLAYSIVSELHNFPPIQKYSDEIEYGFRIFNPSIGFLAGLMKIAALNYPKSGLDKHFEHLTNLWTYEGIFFELMFLFFGGIFLTILLGCATLKPFRRACFRGTRRRSQPRERKRYKGIESCKAVKEEEQLVQEVDKNETVLVIDGLVKDFGKFRAVNDLSISVGHEECFGMLGANGAGKTTTFDIITGLTMPTGGSATIDGHDITETIHIGYCPQFDAMLQQISCRQTLRIMAKLQGYPNVKEVVELVLDCVGMSDFGYKLVKNCSGGQKRKISVGIALMSRATCIILDEPTAGIDPRARREIWDIIHEMREQAKCSIVLTSHSMEECEALCTRIGILRKGEMIALGTSQSLKSQYGNTYMMTLILNSLEDLESVCVIVSEEMPDAVLKTPESSLTTSIVWELPKSKSDKWSEKYNQVEVLAKKANAKDYMLTQASLEDTFIRLITTEEEEEASA
eukprot:NP_493041.1 ABC Transporter family [Caenorhabditis elegans]